MLSKEALNSALPLTEVLDDKGIFLTAVENTPLRELVKATRSDDSFSIPQPATAGTAGYYVDVGTIEFMANKKDDVLGTCAHDITMDQITEVATKAVQGHMLFAKSVVAPAVQELVEKVQLGLQAITISSLTKIEVVVWNPPKPLENASLDAAISKLEGLVMDTPALVMNCPSLTAAEILELMLTGTGSLDEDIKQWAAEKGEGFLLTVWENLFQQKQAGLNETVPKDFTSYMVDPVNGTDNMLAVYLLARHLAEEPINGIQMPAALLEKTAVEFRNQAALRLSYVLSDIDRDKKNGRLVMGQKDTVITVFGPVYREWIENGGEIEVLFGNALQQPCSITVQAIDEKKAECLAQWSRHCSLVTTVEANKRFARVQELLEKAFRDQLISITEEEIASIGNAEMVLNRFREQLALIREDEINDMYALALKLVCASRFYRTDAERILLGIERVKKENPDVSVREAAAMSLIEYVAYWVSAQFKINAR